MRPNHTRARALVAAGALGTTMLAGGAAATAQTQAPQDGAASAASAQRSDAKLRIAGKDLNVRAGRTVRVRGKLLPRQSHRIVRLERRDRGRWRQLDAGVEGVAVEVRDAGHPEDER